MFFLLDECETLKNILSLFFLIFFAIVNDKITMKKIVNRIGNRYLAISNNRYIAISSRIFWRRELP